MTQNDFAGLLGISVKTLRNWEQGRRHPQGAASSVTSGGCETSQGGGRYHSAANDQGLTFGEWNPSFLEPRKGTHMAEHMRKSMPLIALSTIVLAATARAGEDSSTRVYESRLQPIIDPRPILADFPQFVEPVREVARFEAPTLIDDPAADLDVRAWRFSYNARGIIEVPNRLRADRTAVIVVHPWGIDDGQGWCTPQPAGVAFQCTPAKNQIVLDHAATVINPFLKSLRDKVRLVAYSLPGTEDPIRKKIYRSFRGQPSEKEREQGRDGAQGQVGVVFVSRPIHSHFTDRLGRHADGRLLQAIPRPRCRARLRGNGVLGAADPRHEVDRRPPPRRGDLRPRGLSRRSAHSSRARGSGTCSWPVTTPICASAQRPPGTKTWGKTSTCFWWGMPPSPPSPPSPRRGFPPRRRCASRRLTCSSPKLLGFGRTRFVANVDAKVLHPPNSQDPDHDR